MSFFKHNYNNVFKFNYNEIFRIIVLVLLIKQNKMFFSVILQSSIVLLLKNRSLLHFLNVKFILKHFNFLIYICTTD